MKRRQTNNNILSLCLTALFAALICACTFISIPLPFGYFNLGDVAMLLGAYVLGFPAAISAAIDILDDDGGLLIAVYPGHEEGSVEGRLITEMLSKLDRKKICVSKLEIINSPTSPFFFLVEKR